VLVWQIRDCYSIHGVERGKAEVAAQKQGTITSHEDQAREKKN
jgi:hypothetical protein